MSIQITSERHLWEIASYTKASEQDHLRTTYGAVIHDYIRKRLTAFGPALNNGHQVRYTCQWWASNGKGCTLHRLEMFIPTKRRRIICSDIAYSVGMPDRGQFSKRLLHNKMILTGQRYTGLSTTYLPYSFSIYLPILAVLTS